MRRIASGFSHTVLEHNSGWRVINWMTTAILAWWAFILLTPGETFDTSPLTFMAFNVVASEEAWGSLFLAVAAGQAAADVWGRMSARIAAAMMSSATFGVIAILIVAGNPISTGSGTYLLIAFAAGVRLWRLVKVKVNAV